MKSVSYCTSECLGCDTDVFLCITPALLVSGSNVLPAKIAVTDSYPDQCGSTVYSYGFTYDESLLVDPTKLLTTCDIKGVICKGCLTDYINSVAGGGPVGPIALDDLSDVTINTPTNGQVLTYSASTHMWTNQTPTPSGGGTVYAVDEALWADDATTVITHPADPLNNRKVRAVITGYSQFPGGTNGFLLHGDGVNHSTTFVDELGHTVLPVLQGEISTYNPKFGTGSIMSPDSVTTTPYVKGSGVVVTSGSADLTLSTNDFTIDCWAMCPFADVQQVGLMSVSVAPGGSRIGMEWRNGILVVSHDHDTLTFRTAPALGTTNWHHFAVTMSAGTLYTFVDGVADAGTAYPYGDGNWALGGVWYVGVPTDSYMMAYWDDGGFVDEARLLNGICLWTTDFVPPVAPYTVGISSITPLPVTVGNEGIAIDKTTIKAAFTSPTQTTFTNRMGLSIAARLIVEL